MYGANCNAGVQVANAPGEAIMHGPPPSAVPGAAPAMGAQRIQSALTRYTRQEKVGEGSYGKVYKCVDTVTGKYVAVKIISWSSKEEGVPASAIREVSLLRQLHHPNVVRLLNVVPDASKLLLVFEFLEKDLKGLMDVRSTPLVGHSIKMIIYQLLAALHACHARRIVHRDIKPNNILVNKDETIIKLADFGLGRAFALPLQTYTDYVMTLYYRAPEILLGETHYLPAVDMWSVGCVMAELARGQPLFAGQGDFTQIIAIFQLLGTPNETLWPGVTCLPHYNTEFPKWRPKSVATAVTTLDSDGVDLLSGMLRYAPATRLTAFQAMQHRWFDDVRVACDELIRRQLCAEEEEEREREVAGTY